MLQESTITIIKTALEVDAAITKEEKERILAALNLQEQKMERMITTKEVCNLLGITRRTLFNYVQEGKLTAVQYSSRKKRYRYAEVYNFMIGKK
jgi:excisionase family DNA binding protein